MNIGLVLSGGGSRGIAHISAIKALEEFGFFPAHIAGSSVGAIVGALYAYAYNWKDTLTLFKKHLNEIFKIGYDSTKEALINNNLIRVKHPLKVNQN